MNSEEKRYQLIKKLSQYDITILLGMHERVKDQIEEWENGTSFSDAHWCGDTLIDFFENYGINCESEKCAQEQFENGSSGYDYFWCAQELLTVIEEIQTN